MTVYPALIFLAALAPAPQVVHLDVGGVDREALVYPASKPSGKEGAALVFGFHGHGGNMRNAARSFDMQNQWPEAVLVYMQGLPTPGGIVDPEGKKNGWQLAPAQQGGRDLAFFDAMLAKVRKDFRIDSRRIYAMGHSNGGRFTYVLWSSRPDVFAAFGPSGSPATGLLFRMPAKPVFHIAGEEDPLVSYRSQKATIDALIQKNECGKGRSAGDYLTYYAGKNGNDVATYITPGGHEYPRAANAKMVEFFKAHPKPR